MIQEVAVILVAVAIPYCANVRFPVVPAFAKYIVSEVIPIVTDELDKLTKLTAVPIENATDAFAGMVYVTPEPDAL
jgi:hypothetical protein